MTKISYTDHKSPLKKECCLKPLIFLIGMNLSGLLHAFTCHITIVKDNCWSDYDLNLEVFETRNEHTLLQTTLFEGKTYIRKTFECHAKQEISYKATFSPLIWEKDKDKVYYAKQSITLPEEVHPGEKAWTIDVCFSKQFSNVPMPPTAGQRCECDFDHLPPISL
jgi:hypothetical protein